MKKLFSLALVCASALLLAACAQATPEPAEFTITMNEYSYTPNTIEVSVGQQVTIHLVNEGEKQHELMIGRDMMSMEGVPNGFQTDLFESASVEPEVSYMEGMEPGMDDMEMEEMEHEGFMVPVPVAAHEATLTFTATQDMVGEWEMGCFEETGSHYLAGMKGTFVVNP